MVDVRENILARLLVVVATVPNIRSVYRNNLNIDETELPSAVVLDGDEETNDSTDLSMRPANRPTVVQMHPEILIIHQDPNVGTELDGFRRELIKRVLTDIQLNEQIVRTGRFGNGAIRYLGCQTGVGWLRDLHGGMKAQFLFKYTFRPDDL